jgi:hypothetical protein
VDCFTSAMSHRAPSVDIVLFHRHFDVVRLAFFIAVSPG